MINYHKTLVVLNYKQRTISQNDLVYITLRKDKECFKKINLASRDCKLIQTRIRWKHYMLHKNDTLQSRVIDESKLAGFVVIQTCTMLSSYDSTTSPQVRSCCVIDSSILRVLSRYVTLTSSYVRPGGYVIIKTD